VDIADLEHRSKIKKYAKHGPINVLIFSMGEGHDFTALCPDLSGGKDPDDAFSVVPYEKGFAMFRCIEEAVGGENM
jgi:hypothetical protein